MGEAKLFSDIFPELMHLCNRHSVLTLVVSRHLETPAYHSHKL